MVTLHHLFGFVHRDSENIFSRRQTQLCTIAQEVDIALDEGIGIETQECHHHLFNGGATGFEPECQNRSHVAVLDLHGIG